MEMTFGVFVKYLILSLQKDGIVLPFNNEVLFHNLFYRLKNEISIAGKLTFLGKLQFDWDGLHPKSPELSVFLNALCFTGSVETNSPRFDKYWLSKKMEELWQEQFEKLDEATKQCLNSVVNIAREEFERVVNRA